MWNEVKERWKERSWIRRYLCLVLIAILVTTQCTQSWGVTQVTAQTTCPNHAQHNDDCGYAEQVDAHDCIHECDEECYERVLICNHIHDENCLVVTEVEGETSDASACDNHTHEDACYETVKNCLHAQGQHDTECGYAEAKEASECGHECVLCDVASDLQLTDTVFDKNPESVNHKDIVATFDKGGDALNNIRIDDVMAGKSIAYDLSDGGATVTLSAETLAELEEGQHNLFFTMNSGTTLISNLEVTDSQQVDEEESDEDAQGCQHVHDDSCGYIEGENAVCNHTCPECNPAGNLNLTNTEFNKNTESDDYANILITFSRGADELATVEREVKIETEEKTETKREAFAYDLSADGETVTLDREDLQQLDEGKHTFFLIMKSGAELEFQLTISNLQQEEENGAEENTQGCQHSQEETCLECNPVGELEPSEAVFSKDESSENYQDIQVTFHKGADALTNIEREIKSETEVEGEAETEEEIEETNDAEATDVETGRIDIAYELLEDGETVTVTLKKETLEQLEKGQYTLYFMMKSGMEKTVLLTVEQEETATELSMRTTVDVVQINEETFPAEDFREFVKQYDEDGSGGFSEEELKKITVVSLEGKRSEPHTYTDIRGIEYFTSMTSLDCRYGSLTSLDVSDCKTLKELRCDVTQLTSLNVSGLLELEVISCGDNTQLTSLNISDLPSLESLDFSKAAQLTSENVTINNLPKLKILNCQLNLQLTSLDVSSFLTLEELYCDDCPQMTNLNVNGCIALTTLDCSGNRLLNLDISSCQKLTTFNGDGQTVAPLSLYFNSRQGLWLCKVDAANLTVEFDPDNTTFYSDAETQIPLSEEMGFRVDSESHQLTAVNAVPVVSPVYFKTKLFGGEHALSGSFRYTASSGLDATANMIELNEAKTLNHVEELIEEEYITFPNGKPAKYTIECAEFDEKVRQGIPGQYEVTITSGEQVCVIQLEVFVGIDSENNFGDDNFKEYVANNFDTNGDRKLTSEELEKITYIDIHGTLENPQIYTDLKGIEYFRNLRYLHCGTGSLTSLDVSELTELEYLYCLNNDLTSLDISGCTKLKLLFCSNTKLTSLNLENHKNLEELLCYECPELTSLNVSGCSNLITVQSYDSGLTSLLASDCTALDELYCNDNTQLKSLDVSGCVNLEMLNCFGNQITSLDVSSCANLRILNCHENQITSLDVSGLVNLEELRCRDNPLTSLNVSGCEKMNTLSARGTQLRSLDASDLPALKTLWCYKSSLLASIDVSGCTALETIYGYNNPLLCSLDVSACTALKTLNCYNNPLLSSLDVSDCIALKTLEAYGNSQLRSLNVTGCTALETLNCYNNPQLKSLDVSSCNNLFYFNCENCGLESLDVSGLKKLDYLRCRENPLTSLNVSGCKKLRILSARKTNLQSLDVSGLSTLKELHCYECPELRSLTLTGCVNLDYVQCHDGQLTNINFEELPKLSRFEGENQQVSLLPLYPADDAGNWINQAQALNDDVREFAQGTTFTLSNEETDYSTYFEVNEDGTLMAKTGVPTSGIMDFQKTFVKGSKTFTLSGIIHYSASDLLLSEAGIERNAASELTDADGLVTYFNLSADIYEATCADFDEKVSQGVPGRYEVTISAKDGTVSRKTVIEVYVQIENEVNFPNPEFRSFVSQYDTDGNGNLTPAELEKVTEIDLGGKTSTPVTYTDITGIQFFTSLEGLYCRYSSLESLDLSNCTALERLWANGNPMTSINLSNCISLYEVSFSNCGELESLDVSGCTALQSLDVDRCPQLESLDLSSCMALQTFQARNSGLTSLDVSNLSALETLDCYNCIQLKSLNVNGCTALTELDCFGGRISYLDISSCPPLTTFNGANQSIGTLPLEYNEVSGRWVYQSETNGQNIEFDPDNTTFYLDEEMNDTLPEDMDFRIDPETHVLSVGNMSSVVSPVYFKTVLADGENILSGSFHYTVSSEQLVVTTKMIELNEAKEKLEVERDLVEEGYITFEGEAPSEYTIECADFNEKVMNGIPGQYGVIITSGEQVCVFQIEVVVGILSVNFTDEKFKEFVSQYDTDENELLTQQELAKVTTMYVNGTEESPAEYTNLKGIEYFTNLGYLNCSQGSLTSLDVSGLATLDMLYCYGNLQLKNLELGTGLTRIYCYDNESLTQLDVSNCTKLNILHCYESGLTELDVSGLKELEILQCYQCTDLKSLFFSGCEKLYYLDCRESGLESLDVSNLPELEYINCSGNTSLTNLDVSNCMKLEELRCGNCGLTGVLDVRELKKLSYLDCNSNLLLTSVNASDCKRLDYLSVYSSGVTSLSINGCEQLTILSCRDTPIESLDVRGLTKLIRIRANDCPQLERLDVSGCTSLEELFCFNDAQLTSVDASGCTSMKTLNCRNNAQLSSLTLNDCVLLDTLVAYDNPLLTNLDVSSCETLSSLDCYNSGLTSLNVSGLDNLQTLNCYFNQLTELDVSGLDNLTTLRCRNNPLTSLNLTGCANLSFLSTRETMLESLDLGGISSLNTLYCYNNPRLRSLNLTGCIELNYLQCNNCQLTNLNITDCPVTTLIGNDQSVGPLPFYSADSEGNWINKEMTPYDDVREFAQGTDFTCTEGLTDYSDYFDLNEKGVLTAKAGIPTSGTISFEKTLTKGDKTFPLKGEITYSASNLVVSEGRIERNAASALIDDDGLLSYLGLSEDTYEVTCVDFEEKVSLGIPGRYEVMITSKDGEISRNTMIEVVVAINDERNFPNESFQSYLSKFDDDTDNMFTLAELQAVEEINLNENDADVSGYSSLGGIEFFTNLKILTCTDATNLTSLDISKNLMLQSLDCDGSGLRTLTLGANTNLLTLECGGNKLQNLDVSGCTKLQTLQCTGNELESLVVTGNKALTTLYCSNNKLTVLDVGSYMVLKELSCDENDLKELDVSRLTELQSLSCINNQLTDLKVDALDNLSYIDATGQIVESEVLEMSHNGDTWIYTPQDTEGIVRTFVSDGPTKFYEYLVDEEAIGDAVSFGVNDQRTLTATTLLPEGGNIYFTSTLTTGGGYTQEGALEGIFGYIPNYELVAANSVFYTSDEIIWQVLKADTDLKNLEGLLSIDPDVVEIRDKVITSVADGFMNLSKGVTDTYEYTAELSNAVGTEKTLEGTLHVVPKGAVISEDRTEYIYAENFVIGLSTVDSFSETLVREKASPIYENNLNTDVGGSFSISEEDIITIQNITSIAEQDTYPVTLTYSYSEEEVPKEMSIEVQVKIMDDSPEDLIFVPSNIVMTREIGAEQAVGEGKVKLVSSDAEQVLTRTVEVFTDKRFYLTSVMDSTIKLAVDVYNADNSVYNGSDPLVTLDSEHTEGTFKLLSREVDKLKDSRHTGTMQFTIEYGEESDD